MLEIVIPVHGVYYFYCMQKTASGSFVGRRVLSFQWVFFLYGFFVFFVHNFIFHIPVRQLRNVKGLQFTRVQFCMSIYFIYTIYIYIYICIVYLLEKRQTLFKSRLLLPVLIARYFYSLHFTCYFKYFKRYKK